MCGCVCIYIHRTCLKGRTWKSRWTTRVNPTYPLKLNT